MNRTAYRHARDEARYAFRMGYRTSTISDLIFVSRHLNGKGGCGYVQRANGSRTVAEDCNATFHSFINHLGDGTILREPAAHALALRYLRSRRAACGSLLP